METERKQLSEQDINEAVKQYRHSGKYAEEVLQLVKEDFAYGLNKTEIEVYLNSKISYEQKKTLSECLRKGSNVEMAKLFTEFNLSKYQMLESMQAADAGLDFETIKKVVKQELSARGMHLMYQKIRNELNKNSDASNEKYNKELENLHKRLEDKEILLDKQQDELQKANSTVAKMRKELGKKEDVISALNKEIINLKHQLEKTQNEIPAVEQSVSDGKALEGKESEAKQYMIAYASDGRKVPIMTVVERTHRGSNGLLAMWSKLSRKKQEPDIVQRLSMKNLSTAQLEQIKAAMKSGLTEKQLAVLIENSVSAEQMKEIIEIAILENELSN